MTGRPRLLFLSQTLPYPPDSGVAIRTFNVLRLLNERFDVTALCFYRAKSVRSEQVLHEQVTALRGIVPRTEVFPIPQEHSRLRLAADHARSLLRGRVYTTYAYQSRAFARRLRQLLAAERFDLVHMDSLDLSGYLPMLRGQRVVCTHHNVESALLRRRAGLERGLRRRYLLRQADLMEREERRWGPRLALNLTVSEDDAELLRRLVPGSRVAVVPNGVDVDAFQPGGGNGGRGLVYVGGTTWFPNRDALEYFAADLLPRLRRAGIEAPVTWVGRATDDERRRYRDEHGIELTGYVEDIRPYVHGASCFIVPLRVGGGTRLKILDAWAMGMPVVSTSIGCEGLAAVDGENILVRDEPDAFVDGIGRVLRDVQLRERLGAGARATAVERYSWDAIGQSLERMYRELMEEKR